MCAGGDWFGNMNSEVVVDELVAHYARFFVGDVQPSLLPMSLQLNWRGRMDLTPDAAKDALTTAFQ